MPTRFVRGDLFATEGIRAWAHGCNCTGNMDVGVAAVFKRRWPRMFDDYAARCADGRFHLGDVCVWIEGEEVVYSLAIQDHWRAKAKLAALSRALSKTIELAGHCGVDRIALPRIGAGLGGLDWPRVRKVLAELGEQAPVTLEVFEQFVRRRGDGAGA